MTAVKVILNAPGLTMKHLDGVVKHAESCNNIMALSIVSKE